MTKLVELREEIRGELKCVEAEEEIEGVCSVSVAGIVGGCGGSPETSLHAGAEYRDEPHQETTSFCVVSQQCTIHCSLSTPSVFTGIERIRVAVFGEKISSALSSIADPL
ncbi:uncharacterized protein DS421_5g159940 [Arachis hypogaea]|nr:uncharacterized protein DS421_5g159940 [Arachis hypogaea]